MPRTTVATIVWYGCEKEVETSCGLRVTSCGLWVCGLRVTRCLMLDTRCSPPGLIRFICLLVCLSCIGNWIMPLPGIENDGAKRFHHSSFVIRHSSLVIRHWFCWGCELWRLWCWLRIIWYFTVKWRKVLRPIILFVIKKSFYNTHAFGPVSWCFHWKSEAGMMMAVE